MYCSGEPNDELSKKIGKLHLDASVQQLSVLGAELQNLPVFVTDLGVRGPATNKVKNKGPL